MKAWPGVIEQYRDFLPVTDRTPVVTLCEGNTPLIPAPRLAEATDTRLRSTSSARDSTPRARSRTAG